MKRKILRMLLQIMKRFPRKVWDTVILGKDVQNRL